MDLATKPALPLTYTFLLMKTGAIFSGPKGANWFNILKNFGSICLNVIRHQLYLLYQLFGGYGGTYHFFKPI
jgi:hypothetical protein